MKTITRSHCEYIIGVTVNKTNNTTVTAASFSLNRRALSSQGTTTLCQGLPGLPGRDGNAIFNFIQH